MANVTIKRVRYKGIAQNPLLFIHKEYISYMDERGTWIENYHWVSTDKDIQISLDSKEQTLPYNSVLIAIETRDLQEKESSEYITTTAHIASPNNMQDWQLVINSFAFRLQQPTDKYYFLEILWFLCNYTWNSENLLKAILTYNSNFIPAITKCLQHISACLPINKQKKILEVIERLGGKYQINYHKSIVSALLSIKHYENTEIENLNLFELVDTVLYEETKVLRNVTDESLENPFLHLLFWLSHEEVGLVDYRMLISIFSYLPPSAQLSVIKRYFHDVRNKKTVMDKDLLNELANNKHSYLSCFRYCIKNPSEKVNMTVPLLVDTLQTLIEFDGEKFQTFNGILDLAIKNCNPLDPKIDFGLNRLFPQCNGGAIQNENFKGFIYYKLLCEINENKLADSGKLTAIIKHILNRIASPKKYYVCKANRNFPVDKETMTKCEKLNKNSSPQSKCENLDIAYCDNKWLVSIEEKNRKILNLFLSEPLVVAAGTKEIDLQETSTTLFSKNIRSLLLSSVHVVESGLYLVNSDNSYIYRLLANEFFIPKKIRIYPQSYAIMGKDFDVFGIRETMVKEGHTVAFFEDSSSASQEFIHREGQEVKKRVISSLETELNQKIGSEQFFEIPYNKSYLDKLKGLYYFKGIMSPEDNESTISFLNKRQTGNYRNLCSPKLSDVSNPAIGIPYFWCMGKECFHNALHQQTAGEQDDWSKYTLFHLMEIIGFPKLNKTEAGYEPHETVRIFVAMLNKALKKFNRLQCRECGHLLFSTETDRGRFNSYNNFACANPNCQEYNKAVYINYCYHCKKGLIDSRDSARCPNGWHICPTCLSCCDDNLYERMAQRYILQHKPVPRRIEENRGHGHNDKGEYFCPQCGTPLENVEEQNKRKKGCPNCHKLFDYL